MFYQSDVIHFGNGIVQFVNIVECIKVLSQSWFIVSLGCKWNTIPNVFFYLTKFAMSILLILVPMSFALRSYILKLRSNSNRTFKLILLREQTRAVFPYKKCVVVYCSSVFLLLQFGRCTLTFCDSLSVLGCSSFVNLDFSHDDYLL